MCADIVSPAKRSAMMSGIKGKDTRGELTLRKQLFAAGFRFRVHRRDLPGSPDIVLPKYRTAIMVHGCFWHRHAGCDKTTTPSSNVEFWLQKFAGNVQRDAVKQERLVELEWKVATVWECGLRKHGLAEAQFAELCDWIRDAESSSTIEIS